MRGRAARGPHVPQVTPVLVLPCCPGGQSAAARPGCRAWGGVSRAVDLEFMTRSYVRCTKKTASLCCWTSSRDARCARFLWPLFTDWRPPGCCLQRGLLVLDVTTLSGVGCSVPTT